MKILVVSSYLPYPLFSGGNIRLYNLLSILSKTCDVTLVCEVRDHQNKNDIEQVKKICKEVITVKRKKQWSFQNITKTAISSDSFLFKGHKLNEMNNIINNLLKNNKFDLIHSETSYIYPNIPKTNLPIVVVEHNIEFDVYQKFVDNSNILLKPLLKLDIVKLKSQEIDIWKKSKWVVAVSENDKQEINKYTNNVSVVPNGVDLNLFKYKKKNPKNNVLFIGDFKWIQNIDTAKFIIQDIWPLILEKDSDAKLNIVGKNIPEKIKKLTSANSIKFLDNDNRLTPDIFTESGVLLSPIRVGGGTQYKILESMAVGTPVVTTSLGAQGLDVQEDKHLIIGNTKDELANGVIGLLSNSKIYNEIAINSREIIEKNYSWENIAKKLLNVYSQVIS